MASADSGITGLKSTAASRVPSHVVHKDLVQGGVVASLCQGPGLGRGE